MFLEDFDRITEELKNSLFNRNEYLDTLPQNFSEIIIDNDYVEHLSMDYNMLIEELFDDMTEHVYWYLYEWKSGFVIEDNNVKYIINNHEDFVEATKQIYRLPMKT